MAEPTELDELPKATVVRPKRSRISVIWIIPILAALVAVGIAIQRIRSEGPTITIIFNAAEGIEAGKTFVKYKDVIIGRVTQVQLTNDFARVHVTVKISKHSAPLMVEDAKFWVVKPSISITGISGLSTLLSGNYIGFQPGASENSWDTFGGLDEAPVITEQRGRQFVLATSDLGSLDAGTPVYYRRLQVGQVIAFDLTPDGNSVVLKIFVNAPYDKFVYPGTRFWNASGLDISVGADGVNVRTESLVALLVGGVAFETPIEVAPTEPAAANAAFTLYRDRVTALRATDPNARRYVLQFNESLRGLSVGAPVTFLGLPAGEVSSVGLAFDAASGTIRPRVVVTFSPERLLAYGNVPAEVQAFRTALQDKQKRLSFLRRLVEDRGLRAQLKSGNLLTGQLYVALDYYPGAPKVKLDLRQEEIVLPVVPGTFAVLEAKLTSILDKIDRVPLEAIGNNIKKDLESLDETLKSATKLLSDADSQLVPPLKTALEDTHRTLGAVERALTNVNSTLLGPDAPAQQELRSALQDFARAARSLRVLADQLERQPSSVIRGKPDAVTGGK
ncbi:MAG: MlaD family protein [Casimicrobiaceae bacterium]